MVELQYENNQAYIKLKVENPQNGTTKDINFKIDTGFLGGELQLNLKVANILKIKSTPSNRVYLLADETQTLPEESELTVSNMEKVIQAHVIIHKKGSLLIGLTLLKKLGYKQLIIDLQKEKTYVV